MFFRKKNTTVNTPAKKEDVCELSTEDKENITQEIQSIEKTLSLSADAELLEKVAGLYAKLGDVDNAIRCYEKKLSMDNSITNAYRELPKLYNVKRREAAKAGDADQVQYYLDKLDEILKMSKDKVRGRI